MSTVKQTLAANPQIFKVEVKKEDNIMQPNNLDKKYADTLERIFQHPAAHNLDWKDVIALTEHLGTVKEDDGGNLTLTMNSASHIFHRSQDKIVSGVQQIIDLRHLFKSAGNEPAVAKTSNNAQKLRLLVVINQQETLVFKLEGQGSVPEHLHPHDPRGTLHHLKHTGGGDSASRQPENVTYYKAIAETVDEADEILLMGNGTGAASAMAHLKDYLQTHHKEIGHKIVGALTVDVEALSEGQLLHEALVFFMRQDGPEA